TIAGDSVEFDTKTHVGRLVCNVKMVITSQSQLLGNQNERAGSPRFFSLFFASWLLSCRDNRRIHPVQRQPAQRSRKKKKNNLRTKQIPCSVELRARQPTARSRLRFTRMTRSLIPIKTSASSAVT